VPQAGRLEPGGACAEIRVMRLARDIRSFIFEVEEGMWVLRMFGFGGMRWGKGCCLDGQTIHEVTTTFIQCLFTHCTINPDTLSG
jgi:hypothetical protein